MGTIKVLQKIYSFSFFCACRFNLTQDQAPNACSVGVYDRGNDRKMMYNPGDYLTYWKAKYSDKFCFVQYPGAGSVSAIKNFCKRLGGWTPERRLNFKISKFKMKETRNLFFLGGRQTKQDYQKLGVATLLWE